MSKIIMNVPMANFTESNKVSRMIYDVRIAIIMRLIVDFMIANIFLFATNLTFIP